MHTRDLCPISSGPCDVIRSSANRVTHWEVMPARDGIYADIPAGVDPRIRAALKARGIDRIYSHQLATWNEVRAGRSVVLVSPTASGKTLAYNLPVLQALLEDPDARALYLFPTKALSQDQQSELNEVVLGGDIPVKVFTYDGDTPGSIRISARDEGRIIITNPDMLHTGILPNHPKWIKALTHLKFVVIDEMHSYRGVFGSHMTSVIRRLKRIAQFYGASPHVHLLLGHHRQPARAGRDDPRAGDDAGGRERRALRASGTSCCTTRRWWTGCRASAAASCWRASGSPRAC